MRVGGDRTFEVADDAVGGAEDGKHVSPELARVGSGKPAVDVPAEHDVADKCECYGFG
jgi:hypothetical protein